MTSSANAFCPIGRLLFFGEWTGLGDNRPPVFSPYLTGDAKENYAHRVSRRSRSRALWLRPCHAKSEAPRRRYSANFADPVSPIAYSYAP
jgi:hypothetical protein